MKVFKSLFLVVCTGLLLGSCAEPILTQSNGFAVAFGGGKSAIKTNESLQLSLTNGKGLAVDSVAYFLDDIRIGSSTDGNAQLALPDGKVGVRKVLAQIFSGDTNYSAVSEVTVLAENPPVTYDYEILETYPHDINAFTQGIEFVGDTLYESTGQIGRSSLRKVNMESGEVLAQIPLVGNQFGEGLTVLDDKIYQLTWLDKIGLVYDLNTFTKEGVFFYNDSPEGWGLCNDGEKIFKSDGSSRIWILDPQTMIEQDYIQIYTNTSMIDKINELEYIDGKIYANVWQYNAIAIINPETGVVEGQIDIRGLKDQVTQHEKVDVLNGIAYKGVPGELYLTGKLWDKLFKVRLVERQ